MQKTEEISGFISDLPLNCVLETDIYTDKGVLLCPRMTVVNERVLQSLNHYKGFICATITYQTEGEDEPELEKDDSFEFDSLVKNYIEDGIETLYNNLDDVDTVIKTTDSIATDVVGRINTSKELGINLAKLKVSDEYTYKHSVDVGTMAGLLARRLQMNDNFIKDITVAGFLHDIGKEKIPAEILNKPAKLTDEEFAIMKMHPVHAYQMLMNTSDITEEIRQGVLNHHENVDGTGYPRGLTDLQIGKMGKILTIVDVFDALVTVRPYKNAKTPAQAIEIMYTMSNKFDVEYFRAFLSIINAYPNGTYIKLSNGETALVLKQNKTYPLRPIVKIKETDEIVDLSTDENYLSAIIVN